MKLACKKQILNYVGQVEKKLKPDECAVKFSKRKGDSAYIIPDKEN
jgi:hypothetical protein